MSTVAIAPTVGRIVHFHQSPTCNLCGGAPLAAIVAAVHSLDSVNLTVFDGNGVPHQRASVLLVHASDDASKPGDGYFCCWPPRDSAGTPPPVHVPPTTLEPPAPVSPLPPDTAATSVSPPADTTSPPAG